MDRNDKPRTKGQPSQNNPHMRRDASTLEGHIWHASLPGVDKSWEWKKSEKKEQKKNWLSCHALEKFELSLNENQKSQVKKNVLRKWWKNCINTNHSSLARNYFSV